jgi:hypothetical protein
MKPDDGLEGIIDVEDDTEQGAGEKRSRPNDEPVTLDAIAKLLDDKFDKRLLPISASIDKLTQDLGIFKTKMNDELAAMGLNLKQVQAQGSEAVEKVAKLEKDMQDLKDGTQAEITKSLNALQLDAAGKTDTNLTVVIGNIPAATTLEHAANWVTKRCVETGVPQPVEIFTKSETFAAIAFAKCTSASHRDNLIASVRNAPTGSLPKQWANVDQPINIRTAASVLFAFKRLLGDWGYNKKSVWVDTEKLVLSVAGKEVMKTVVENYVLKISWCDGEWEEWSDLQSAGEFITLKSTAQGRLDKMKDFKGDAKGKGKGPE